MAKSSLASGCWHWPSSSCRRSTTPFPTRAANPSTGQSSRPSRRPPGRVRTCRLASRTPVLLFGHDENGKGEIIDMTPADLLHLLDTGREGQSQGARQQGPRSESVREAIDMVQGGESVRKAANATGVAESTLRNRIKKLRVLIKEVTA